MLPNPAKRDRSAARRHPRTVLYLDHTAKWSGGEIALLRTLKAIDREKVRPVAALAADGPFAERLRESNIETHVLPLSEDMREVRKDSLGGGGAAGKITAAGRFALYACRVAQFARHTGAEILHCNSLKADIYGALAGKIARLPVVWHVRDHIDPSYLPMPAVRLFRSFAGYLPDYVITNSESARQSLFPKGQGRQRVRAIHDGLLPEDLKTPPPATFIAGKNRLPRIGMVGRLVEWKGQHIFLDAALRLIKAGRQAEFVIIGAALFGEAAYEASLLDQAERIRSAGGQVAFLGFQTDVPRLLHELDIFIHASTTPEPFGQVIIEAMAAGRPVIGSDGGGVREIIVPGKNGLLAPMGNPIALSDAICCLLDDPGQALQIAQAGYADVRQRFTAERNARSIEAVYEEIVPLAEGRR